MKPSIINSQQFDLHWRGHADYVTAITWSPQGKTLAVSSAAGEVMLARSAKYWRGRLALLPLQIVGGNSIDLLAFSRDGQNLLLAVKMDK